NIGLVYAKMGCFKKALGSYRKAVNIDPSYKQAWNNMGFLYFDSGFYIDAEYCYNMAIKIDPMYDKALNNLELLRGVDRKSVKRSKEGLLRRVLTFLRCIWYR
ncbi:MAG: tetratricopeptide repeat protein, partial [Synergistetes bacterium]|nr:tetratricopeptide repeat protein [Synergistota bacterium]